MFLNMVGLIMSLVILIKRNGFRDKKRILILALLFVFILLSELASVFKNEVFYTIPVIWICGVILYLLRRN